MDSLSGWLPAWLLSILRGDESMSDEISERDVANELDRMEAEESASRRKVARERAKTAAEVAAELQREKDEAEEKIRAEAAKKRAAAFKSFCKSIGDFMHDNGIENPRTIPDSAVSELRDKAGL